MGQNNPTKKNLCISVKSVGQNNPTKKNLRHLRNLRDKNNPTKKNLCKSVKSVGQNNPTKKNLRHLRNLRDKKQQMKKEKRVCHKSMTHPLFLYYLYPKLSYMMLSGSTPRESR